MTTVKGLDFNFKYNTITMMKAEKIAKEHGLALKDCLVTGGTIMLAACCETPDLFLEKELDEIESIVELLSTVPEYKNFEKQLLLANEKNNEKKDQKTPNQKK